MAKAALTYTWQGKDRHGQARKGEISATSLSEAKNLLRRQGFVNGYLRGPTASAI